jgi:hypothetical protein
VKLEELRVEYIGMTSLHGDASLPALEPYEVRIRFAGRARARRDAVKLGNEVETLVGKACVAEYRRGMEDGRAMRVSQPPYGQGNAVASCYQLGHFDSGLYVR